jgi:hypothetical protein
MGCVLDWLGLMCGGGPIASLYIYVLVSLDSIEQPIPLI